jgi:putative transposon-encoded protein
MKKIPVFHENHLEVYNISEYFTRTVTKFGNGAKMDCPKEYLGKKVIVVVL